MKEKRFLSKLKMCCTQVFSFDMPGNLSKKKGQLDNLTKWGAIIFESKFPSPNDRAFNDTRWRKVDKENKRYRNRVKKWPSHSSCENRMTVGPFQVVQHRCISMENRKGIKNSLILQSYDTSGVREISWDSTKVWSAALDDYWLH